MSQAAISGIGMCTSLGLNTAATEAAFRAGLLWTADTPIKSRTGEPVKASALSSLPYSLDHEQRIIELAARALDDLSASSFQYTGEVSIAIAAPALTETLQKRFRNSITGLLRSRFNFLATPEFFFLGRSAFFFALQAALSTLKQGRCRTALVGTLDSLCAPNLLRYLDSANRLLGVGVEGVLPGEGAAFVGLETAGSAASDLQLGTILCASVARESRHFEQHLPNKAEALASVFRQLRNDPAGRGKRADILFTCETGERFWSQEFSLAYFRNTPIMPEPFAKTMAAESFGDLGAAGGGILLGLGLCTLARRRRLIGSAGHLLLYGSSDDGHLGACLVKGPTSPLNVN